jgi:hypothetical protein
MLRDLPRSGHAGGVCGPGAISADGAYALALRGGRILASREVGVLNWRGKSAADIERLQQVGFDV